MATGSPTIGWKWKTQISSERTYRAILTYFQLPRDNAILSAFQRLSGEIIKQLDATAGLVGYSLHASFATQQFWTLSVWDNEDAIAHFMKRAPHSSAMLQFEFDLLSSKFERWDVGGLSEPTVSWLSLLAARPRREDRSPPPSAGQ